MKYGKDIGEHYLVANGFSPYLVFDTVDMNGITGFELSLATRVGDTKVRITLDAEDGKEIANVNIPATSAPERFTKIKVDIKKRKGTHKLYFHIGSTTFLGFKGV